MRCPFCENANDHRLFVLAIEGEKHLRIDYCDAGSGYLKTYIGEGGRERITGRLDLTSSRSFRQRAPAETIGYVALRDLSSISEARSVARD